MTTKYYKAMDENYDYDADSIKKKLDQAPEFIRGINWGLLKKQKLDLLRTIAYVEETENVERLESLNGILHLIDALQDYVCDEIGMPDYMIYTLHDDDDNEIFGEEFNEQEY